MIEIPVFNTEGKETEKITLSDEVFNAKIKPGVVHAVVTGYLANRRRGTASTKTRAEVRGGGRKPWRQKGTGRARAGSIRSPIWRGGGVIFGPKPRDYSWRLPAKLRALALRGILSSRIAEGMFMVMDGLKADDLKTKTLYSILGRFNPGKALLVTEDRDTARTARNIPGIRVVSPQNINAYDVARCNKIMVTRDALPMLEARMKTRGQED